MKRNKHGILLLGEEFATSVCIDLTAGGSYLARPD